MVFYKNTQKNKGFLVLTMVLLVCAVVMIVSAGSLFRSINDANEGTDSERALKAWSTVNACGEYALAQIAPLSGWTEYTGDAPLQVGAETCYIYPIEDSEGSKIINASSTVSGFTKKISIEVATNTPKVIITSWEEVADFAD
jgi:hypothetical protein